MRVLGLFSGGKDSTLAVDVVRQWGWDVRGLVSLSVEGEDSWMFHRPNVHVTPTLAGAMGLPHHLARTSGEKEREVDDLENAVRDARKQFGAVDGIVAGAIASEYQRTRIERVGHRLGLRTFAPLWHKEPVALLRSLVAAGYDIRFVQCSAEGLTEPWLGRRLDASAVDDLESLRDRRGVHAGGEGGEYETLVLDGPFFRQRAVVDEATPEWRRDSGAWHVRRIHVETKAA